jgi:arginine-tRNA-protein transferase
VRVLQEFDSEPRVCSYLNTEIASLTYRVMLDVSPEQYESMLERGWRRFGPMYFRPAPCPKCNECVSIRLRTETFRLSRGQRRVVQRAQHLRSTITEPKMDAARLGLYQRWHDERGVRRGWSMDVIDEERYWHEFVFPHPVAHELTLWDDQAGGGPVLVAVSLVDITPRAVSAVYTYFDPSYAELSPGTVQILRQVELARRLDRAPLYLGYRVRGCASSEYKANFRPHELLSGWPGPEDAPDWRPSAEATIAERG